MFNIQRIQLLIKAITADIFKPEDRRLTRSMLDLAIEGCAYDSRLDGFYFQGQLFSKLEFNARSPGVYGNPHVAMVPALQKFMTDYRNTQSEKIRVSQALTIILRNCRSDQDIFDALPDLLHQAFLDNSGAGAEKMTRCREEAWTVQDNPRALAQYHKLRDLVQFYNITKLLY